MRLPNWLGDLVMSSAFISELRALEPAANIEVIVKDALAPLASLLPGIDKVHGFSKKDHPGLGGAIRFGKTFRKGRPIDLFFCLPNSFSSAAMAYFTGARKRIGYRSELRGGLLSRPVKRKPGLHRAEDYLQLLSAHYRKTFSAPAVGLSIDQKSAQTNAIVLNFNSEAQSRRMPEVTAIALAQAVLDAYPNPIVLVGGPNEAESNNRITSALNASGRVTNLAGTTTLAELANTLGTAAVVISTDSGPAHLANALGTPTIACFSAGNEASTAPYNANARYIVRSSVACSCATSNTCKLGEPPCLLALKPTDILEPLAECLKN